VIPASPDKEDIAMTVTSDRLTGAGPRLLLTVPEAAEALAISRSKLYELLASGAIASVRIDGSRRIPLTALEEYVSRLLAERTAA
jgi:excisionase family DNA binding protein